YEHPCLCGEAALIGLRALRHFQKRLFVHRNDDAAEVAVVALETVSHAGAPIPICPAMRANRRLPSPPPSRGSVRLPTSPCSCVPNDDVGRAEWRCSPPLSC